MTKSGIDPELLNTDKMLADYYAMEAEKESLLAKIREDKEIAERIETLSAEFKKIMMKDDRER